MKKNLSKKEIPDSVRKYFATIGSRGARSLLEKRGPEHFSKISKMRKGIQFAPDTMEEIVAQRQSPD